MGNTDSLPSSPFVCVYEAVVPHFGSTKLDGVYHGRNRQSGIFTSNDSAFMLYGTYLEPRHIQQWSRQATKRQAYDVRRVSVLSCCQGMDGSNELALISKFGGFLQTHCPNLEWLLITGPMLLEKNEQACAFLSQVPFKELERLSLGVGQAANVSLANALAMLLSKATNLNHLNVRTVSWQNPQALLVLAGGVARSRSLTWLDLSSCKITDQGFRMLARALTSSSSASPVETLLLSANYMTSSSLVDVVQLISKRNKLASLNLSQMPLFEDASPAQLQSLFQAIQLNSKLVELNLTGCSMTEKHLRQLLDALATSQVTHIETLCLSGNPFSEQGRVKHLTTYLPRLHSLSYLSIVSSATPPPLEQPEEEDDNDHNNGQHWCAETRQNALNEFLQALSLNTRLTQLVWESRRRLPPPPPRGQEDNSLGGDKDRELDWVRARIVATLERNLLARRLSMAGNNQLPLSVWPRFLANTDSPSKTFQVLDHHMVAIRKYID